MHKKELVLLLRKGGTTYDRRIEEGDLGWLGQKPLALFFAEYLERLEIPYDAEYDFWRIDDHLPELLVAAFETLRISDEKWVSDYREMYELDTGHEVPNITDLGESRMGDRTLAVQTNLGFMFRDIMGVDWIENHIEKYCNAQHYVLQQTMDKFLRRVWWQGMFKMTDECSVSGMSGKFGNTELRTYVIAGRIMFTFVRRKEGETIIMMGGEEIDRLPYEEDSVSFVGDDSDPLALGTGLQSFETNFRTALDMIEDVVNNWPESQREREAIYKADKKVSIA